MRLAENVLSHQTRILEVPRLPYDSLTPKISNNVARTPYEGIFARNLYMTMAPKGAVIYGETLFQDNIVEAGLLGRKEVKVIDHRSWEATTYMVPKRVEQVAEGYVSGIAEYIKQNVVLSEEKEKREKGM